MKPLFRLIILLFLLIILPLSVWAQRKPVNKGRNFKYRVSSSYRVREVLSVYGSLGLANYYGDLCDNFECIQPRPTLGAGMIYRLSNYLASKSELNYVRLYSEDVWPDRNLSFRSGNIELYTSLMYDYFPYTKVIRKRKLLSPYVFAGVGLTYYNPKAELNGKWHTLRPLKTEGVDYWTIAPIIPFGLGVKIKKTKNWDFLVEASYRLTFTDYLDDVSSYSFKKQSEFDNPEAASLSNRTQQGDGFLGYRGNPKKNDGYATLTFKTRYTFTSKHVYKNKYNEQHRKVY